jgi:hypothetical protein
MQGERIHRKLSRQKHNLEREEKGSTLKKKEKRRR